MKQLRRRQFGDPILRLATHMLTPEEIVTPTVQGLIKDMQVMLQKRAYGVGLAAPQVGKSLSLSVIGIKPTPSRPKNPRVELVVINPRIVKAYGRRTGMWEGCISFGIGPGSPYAKALRYKKVRVAYFDENGREYEKDFDGILGHVLQHEIDHLNGVLFVDHIVDSKTYTTIGEYRKHYMIKQPARASPVR
jgi:peptide deformylase